MDDREQAEIQRKADRFLRRKIRECQRQLYLKMLEEGFTEEQAMALMMSCIEATPVPMI